MLLFTQAHFAGRALFRAVRVELSAAPGAGRLLLEVGAGAEYERSFQAALRSVVDVGRARLALPWGERDLVITCRTTVPGAIALSGASASLPLFLGCAALLAGRALPDHFLATGVADGEALAPAPREYIQGKLEFADAYLRQRGARAEMWVPAGSAYDASRLGAVAVREVPSLPAAAERVLGLSVRGAEARP